MLWTDYLPKLWFWVPTMQALFVAEVPKDARRIPCNINIEILSHKSRFNKTKNKN